MVGILVLAFAFINCFALSSSSSVSIGLILGPQDRGYHEILKNSLNKTNTNSELVYDLEVEQLDNTSTSSFKEASNRLLKKKVVTILISDYILGAIADEANEYHIPVINVGDFSEPFNHDTDYGFQIRPDIFPAVADIIQNYKWNTFIYLYKSDSDIISVADNVAVDRLVSLTSKFVKVHETHAIVDTQDAFRKLNELKWTKITDIILNFNADFADEFFRYYYEQTPSSERQKMTFVLMQQVADNFWKAPYIKALNVIGFRLYDPKSENALVFISTTDLRTLDTSKVCLYHDAGLIITETFNKMSTEKLNKFVSSYKYMYDIDKKKVFQDGEVLRDLYKKVNILTALTGPIHFNKKGIREYYSVDVLKTVYDSVEKVFEWSDQKGLGRSSVSISQSDSPVAADKSKTLIVSSILHEPYLMVKKNQAGDNTGTYEGYIKDLLDLLSQRTNYTFEIRLVKDGSYGYRRPNGKWQGMIGEVVSKEVDLAVSDITITSARLHAVDFLPFATVSISMLLKRPSIEQIQRDNAPTAYFFLNGFSTTVWLCVLLAYVGVGAVIFFVSKLANNSIHQPIGILSGVDHAFGLIFFRKKNMQSKNISVKFLCGVWWLFTFFLAVLYVSSMTSSIMVQLLDVKTILQRQDILTRNCHSVMESYVKTGKPEVSVLALGSTYSFFKNSKIPLYARYYETIASQPNVTVKNYAQGIERVRLGNGNFAFLMESRTGNYISLKDCDFYVAPGTFDTRQYGIAITYDSPYKDILRHTLQYMQEDGTLDLLEKKWWVKQCHIDEEDWLKIKSLDHSPVDLAQISGVFYFLLAGIALTFIIFVLDLCIRRRIQGHNNTSADDRQELADCEDEDKIGGRRMV